MWKTSPGAEPRKIKGKEKVELLYKRKLENVKYFGIAQEGTQEGGA